ncbi:MULTISPECIES: YpjP family protein [unclassified Bacillus (in: firmicutes)]|uniref:YpjP family protein n=1 Tax=unclassified Bacillus (in: firmicutes) TaxID=185979 RepID=UPI001BE98B73|nr:MULTISPECIES: YpjP family protein [unclassified Bacillus (in: firmicutes)]MBT2639139.1 YpjP family protein [Bacillus sp. ISL-39]MBT2662385.1 YpjP family protein [Bacillus sp. ISL-45]
MPAWLLKSLVVMISIVTFGMVSPAQVNGFLTTTAERSEKSTSAETSFIDSLDVPEDEEAERDLFIDRAMREAEQQSFQKFGTKIGPVIEDEFRQSILPNIEMAIETVAFQYPGEKLNSLRITEMPGGGESEKIFHITGDNGKDIIRFHVRRDQPPKDGFWFNFHYHTYHDDFQTHYELGKIFWAKNTPPKWKS